MAQRNPEIQFGTNKKGVDLSVAEASELLGVTPTTLTKWCKKGCPHKGGNGKRYSFDSAKVVRWRMQKEADDIRAAYEQEEYEDDSEHISINEAKRRKEVAVALTAELSLAKERELVANIEDILNNVEDALVSVRAKLVSMPSRLSGSLSHQEEENISEILETEINDMLEELSNYNHEYVEGENE